MIAVLSVLTGLIIQETVLDFIIYLLRGIWLYLARILADVSTVAQNFIGLILMALGFVMLFTIVHRAQQNINKRISQIEARRNERDEPDGLEIIKTFEQWINQEKQKLINLTIRNNHDAPLRIEARLMPVKYRTFEGSKWQDTKYDHLVGFSWRDWVIEPKKIETIRLAQADREDDSFFVHCSTNNPYRMKDVGEYSYRMNINAKDDDGSQYELGIIALIKYYGGTHLEFTVDQIS